MNLTTVLLVAGALIGIGVWGALAQQSFVMIMMGVELWSTGPSWPPPVLGLHRGGAPQGQVLVIVAMAVMAVEMAIGFALVAAVYRPRQADMTEGIGSLRG